MAMIVGVVVVLVGLMALVVSISIRVVFHVKIKFFCLNILMEQ